MTVKELIGELQKHDGDMPVYMIISIKKQTELIEMQVGHKYPMVITGCDHSENNKPIVLIFGKTDGC